jgi:hypothetical protein
MVHVKRSSCVKKNAPAASTPAGDWKRSGACPAAKDRRPDAYFSSFFFCNSITLKIRNPMMRACNKTAVSKNAIILFSCR